MNQFLKKNIIYKGVLPPISSEVPDLVPTIPEPARSTKGISLPEVRDTRLESSHGTFTETTSTLPQLGSSMVDYQALNTVEENFSLPILAADIRYREDSTHSTLQDSRRQKETRVPNSTEKKANATKKRPLRLDPLMPQGGVTLEPRQRESLSAPISPTIIARKTDTKASEPLTSTTTLTPVRIVAGSGFKADRVLQGSSPTIAKKSTLPPLPPIIQKTSTPKSPKSSTPQDYRVEKRSPRSFTPTVQTPKESKLRVTTLSLDPSQATHTRQTLVTPSPSSHKEEISPTDTPNPPEKARVEKISPLCKRDIINNLSKCLKLAQEELGREIIQRKLVEERLNRKKLLEELLKKTPITNSDALSTQEASTETIEIIAKDSGTQTSAVDSSKEKREVDIATLQKGLTAEIQKKELRKVSEELKKEIKKRELAEEELRENQERQAIQQQLQTTTCGTDPLEIDDKKTSEISTQTDNQEK